METEFVFGMWVCPQDQDKRRTLLHFSGTWDEACAIRDAITAAGYGIAWEPHYEPAPIERG